MIAIKKDAVNERLSTTLVLHVVSENLTVNYVKNSIRGVVQSFATNNIEEAYNDQGVLAPVATFVFTINEADLSNVALVVEKYLDENIATIASK